MDYEDSWLLLRVTSIPSTAEVVRTEYCVHMPHANQRWPPNAPRSHVDICPSDDSLRGQIVGKLAAPCGDDVRYAI